MRSNSFEIPTAAVRFKGTRKECKIFWFNRNKDNGPRQCVTLKRISLAMNFASEALVTGRAPHESPYFHHTSVQGLIVLCKRKFWFNGLFDLMELGSSAELRSASEVYKKIISSVVFQSSFLFCFILCSNPHLNNPVIITNVLGFHSMVETPPSHSETIYLFRLAFV